MRSQPPIDFDTELAIDRVIMNLRLREQSKYNRDPISFYAWQIFQQDSQLGLALLVTKQLAGLEAAYAFAISVLDERASKL